MYIAASTLCLGDCSFAEACQQLAELEFTRIELAFHAEYDQLHVEDAAGNPERFVARYRETTRLTPVAISLEQDVDPSTFGGIAKLAKMLRIAQITVPASPLGAPFNTEIDRLRELQVLASRGGIRLSIKTKVGHLTEDPLTAIELCQAVDGLGITLDPSHYVCRPGGSISYEKVFPYVYHVHLRDTTPKQLQGPIGLGQIDYSRLVNRLRRRKYNRALSVELLPSLLDPQQRPLELRKMRMLLETLL